jgi:hypothetical protein
MEMGGGAYMLGWEVTLDNSDLKDKWDVYTLTNMHRPPTQGNLCDKCSKAKQLIVMGYINKGDRVANSYSFSWRTWKWTKSFFHLLDITE